MAISIVSSAKTSRDETTSHQITMPASITAGNLLVVFFTCDGDTITIEVNTALSGSNWILVSEENDSVHAASFIYKIAEGSDVLYITTSATESSTAIAYNISGTSSVAPVYAYQYGLSTNAVVNDITPINGSQEYLFIVYAAIDGTIIASAAPLDFTGLTTEEDSSEGSSSSSAYRLYTTGSNYAPAPFTSAYGSWITMTICISPAGVDGIGIANIAYYEYI